MYDVITNVTMLASDNNAIYRCAIAYTHTFYIILTLLRFVKLGIQYETYCKGKFLCRAVSSLQDCSNMSHFIPWQICSIEHNLNFSVKHPVTLQSMRAEYSYTNITTVYSQVLTHTA